jgi:hypothetical protein
VDRPDLTADFTVMDCVIKLVNTRRRVQERVD